MSKKTYYGEFGGQFVSESLMNTLQEIDAAFEEAIKDEKFLKEYHYYLKQYVGRETPLYFAERLSEKYKTKIYLKREDLNHTGAHKTNDGTTSCIFHNMPTCALYETTSTDDSTPSSYISSPISSHNSITSSPPISR